MPQGWVEMRRETKRQPGPGQTLLGPSHFFFERNAERGQNIGAAAAAGYGPVAVFHHRHTSTGRNQGRRRAYVISPDLITPDATRVEDPRTPGLEVDHVFTEDGRGGGQFAGRFALQSQGGP